MVDGARALRTTVRGLYGRRFDIAPLTADDVAWIEFYC